MLIGNRIYIFIFHDGGYLHKSLNYDYKYTVFSHFILELVEFCNTKIILSGRSSRANPDTSTLLSMIGLSESKGESKDNFSQFFDSGFASLRSLNHSLRTNG